MKTFYRLAAFAAFMVSPSTDSFDTTKTSSDIVQGIGPNLSAGRGASALAVGSVGFSLTNSWDSSTPH